MRRLIAIILVICLCLGLCLTAQADGVYFTAVNDSLLPLSGYMPVYLNGVLCAPYTVFTQTGLGISYSGVSSSDVVSLYNSSYMLYFNTAEGFAFDTNLNEFNSAASYYGGMLYVPVGFVCAYFGLQYSVLSSGPAPVLRIRSSSSFSDADFLTVYSPLMQSLIDTYNAEQGADDEEPIPSATIMLTFNSVTAEHTPEILDILDKFGCSAAFFASADDILAAPDVMRRIVGSGYSVGIYLKEGTIAEYERASELLFEAARTATVLVSCSDDVYDSAASLCASYGLRLWTPSEMFDETFDGYSSSVTARFTQEENSVQSVGFACSEHNSDIMPNIFSYLVRREYNMGHINELTEPV